MGIRLRYGNGDMDSGILTVRSLDYQSLPGSQYAATLHKYFWSSLGRPPRLFPFLRLLEKTKSQGRFEIHTRNYFTLLILATFVECTKLWDSTIDETWFLA